MSVTITDIQIKKAIRNSDADDNGGQRSTVSVTSGRLHDVFPVVSNADRVTGITRYRKLFFLNTNAEDKGALEVQSGFSSNSDADDYFRLALGSFSDVQSDIDTITAWAGAGTLYESAAVGATSLAVAMEAADGFFNSCGLRLSDGTNVSYNTVDAEPAWDGNNVTIALSESLPESLSIGASVSAMISLPDLKTAFSDVMIASSSGAYDYTTYPILIPNATAKNDSWTLTFQGTTPGETFAVSGAATGSVGAGNIATDFIATNNYFTIQSDGWTGSWSTADTLKFNTTAAAAAVWAKQVVPDSTPSHYSAEVVFVLSWESE